MDITSKVTGSTGNVTLIPELGVKTQLELTPEGIYKLWFSKTGEFLRGPVGLNRTQNAGWPGMGGLVQTPRLIGMPQLQEVQELYFQLVEGQTRVYTILSLYAPNEFHYWEGIAWDENETSKMYLNLDWFQPTIPNISDYLEKLKSKQAEQN